MMIMVEFAPGLPPDGPQWLFVAALVTALVSEALRWAGLR